MYLVKTPPIVKNLFPRFTWNGDVSPQKTEKTLYLTFDDGPIPHVTPWVLHELAQFNAKATFFCVGDNVCRNTPIYNSILAAGHSVGNHTFNHYNGWTTPTEKYLHNVAQCAAVVQSDLFRPPYGRVTPQQAAALRNEYSIVMWDVLSGDFDQKISPDKCLQNVLRHTTNGSIIVFHDNVKAAKNLFYSLPRVLEHFTALGFQLKALPMHANFAIMKDFALKTA